MLLTNINTIKNLLKSVDFKFSKGLGQNFLINSAVCPKMAELSGVSENTGVLEIGPGIGVLTVELAKRASKVVAIELDERLKPVLETTLSPYKNTTVIYSDVLKLDIKEIIKKHFANKNIVVCANLPYYITSPVIMSLLENDLPLKSVTVMVQKEAAQRICAPVGSRQSGALTVAVNFYGKPAALFEVSAGSFLPAPKVDSTVLKIELHETNPYNTDKIAFRKTVRAAFSQRRKTIQNSLSAGLSISKEQTAEILKNANIEPNKRAEQLSMDDFCCIANQL